ncbi:hypothetical protein BJX66DRAFT_308231 [Aspergillus keveii]|uniref:Lysine-specific metallo-endopeptidase domain-containing protein n=1 Tax=Aspergillus keveii TaxID=714993 RepID=A0ABR4FZU5_9EURO
MAKCLFLLGLITGLLVLLPCTIAVEMNDIFTVQSGTGDGGCDDRADVLDQWLSECIQSIDVTLLAMDRYDRDVRVRRALSTIFGLRNSGRLGGSGTRARLTFNTIRDYIEFIGNFFNQQQKDGGGNMYPSSGFWLFCDSTFLALHNPTDPASDYKGEPILDENGDPVPIRDVPEYQMRLEEDPNNEPWWSGDLTDLNGYYFTEYGGNYCYEDDLGVTAGIEPLGGDEVGQDVVSVILCPYSFENGQRPDSYQDANNLLRAGTNLADAIPKSATLLHEAFHAIHGGIFLAGDNERYDIATCLNLATTDPVSAQHNPENYVFFIAHMYHMFGVEEGNEPWSIHTQWNFDVIGTGQNRIYGAVETEHTEGLSA